MVPPHTGGEGTHHPASRTPGIASGAMGVRMRPGRTCASLKLLMPGCSTLLFVITRILA
jgi:hypothetical protein